MIRSNKQQDIQRNIEPAPAAPISQAVPPRPVAQETSVQGTAVATIGPKIRFKGELVGEEDLLVQGQVDGTIDLRGNTLTIGNQGTVKANVLAKTITIEGTVEGDIYGKERIEIKSSSNVKGNLVADRVTLEDGAKFKGSIDMDISAHKAIFEGDAASKAYASSSESTSGSKTAESA